MKQMSNGYDILAVILLMPLWIVVAVPLLCIGTMIFIAMLIIEVFLCIIEGIRKLINKI
ncbi:hypothetical protein [Peptostreptococcus faecalis]|uniref:hypothetical protein n=1 Tax=Peptostreptococcus faecalis TaxID=2045015 RepID=UPI0015E07D20|nr:hypothetical protein [Peptostreptococcus faecalis]